VSAPAQKANQASRAREVTLACACGCGAATSVPSRLDPARGQVPIQAHPYIALACWLAGWRATGPEATPDGERWRVWNPALPRGEKYITFP
jgi:hypothetical protein